MELLQRVAPDRVAFFDLENAQGVPIYVHAKICVVDDVWFTCGSDNFNRRSWTNDSELTCAVLDPELHGERTAAEIPGATIELIHGGHMLPVTHPAAADGGPVALARVAHEGWAAGYPGGGMAAFVRRVCNEHGGFEPAIHHHTNELTALLALVAEGHAITLLPEIAAQGRA